MCGPRNTYEPVRVCWHVYGRGYAVNWSAQRVHKRIGSVARSDCYGRPVLKIRAETNHIVPRFTSEMYIRGTEGRSGIQAL